MDRWLETEASCPLCRANDISRRFALKGFEEATLCMRMLDNPGHVPSSINPVVIVSETDSEDNDFEELPSFRTPSRSGGDN